MKVEQEKLCTADNGFPRLSGLCVARPQVPGQEVTAFYILCFGFTMVKLPVVSPAYLATHSLPPGLDTNGPSRNFETFSSVHIKPSHFSH